MSPASGARLAHLLTRQLATQLAGWMERGGWRSAGSDLASSAADDVVHVFILAFFLRTRPLAIYFNGQAEGGGSDGVRGQRWTGHGVASGQRGGGAQGALPMCSG
jgi:hypothetical protein